MSSTIGWLVLYATSALAVGALARGFWIYRKSLTWPTADGEITRLDVERRQTAGEGHYYCATFSYDFRDPDGARRHGTWSKNFSSDGDARKFAARELPVGRRVIVRFDPKNPETNGLELDSCTYTGDRPLDLGV